MPLKLNVGLSKKVGEANYGSRGAIVNFDVEIEASLIQEPEQLREKIRYLFGLAKTAVEEELNGQPKPNNNGHHTSSNGSHKTTKGRPATGSQVRAIHAIAIRNGIDLDQYILDQYGVRKVNDLSIGHASDLIDFLKSQANTTGGLR